MRAFDKGNSLKYLVSLCRKSCGYIFIKISVGLVSVLCGLLFIMHFRRAVDIAVRSVEGDLVLQLILMALFIVLSICFSSLSSWIGSRKYVSFGNELRHEMFFRVLQMPWSASAKMHTGEIINRLDKDVAEVNGFIVNTLPALFVMIVQFAVYFIYMFYLDRTLAIIMLASAPVIFVVYRKILKYSTSANRKLRTAEGNLFKLAGDTLNGRVVVKALSFEKYHVSAFDEAQNDYRKVFLNRAKISVVGSILNRMAFSLGLLFVFIWCILKLYNGVMTFGTMTAFMQLVSRLQKPATGITQMFSSVALLRASLERMQEYVSLSNEIKKNDIFIDRPLGLRVSDLSFSYTESNKSVIENMNFVLPPGRSLAVIGETGRGKTTLARLILALSSPDKGMICFYSDEGEYQLTADTRCNISYVPQGYSLFSGTVRDNLKAVNQNASDAELEDVLGIASADFVLESNEGLDMVVGESGFGLSEGQAQRIAIARALLSKGRFMLFDEATSALDEKTESIVISNIKKKYPQKTLLFITHSSNVVSECDDVLFL